MKTNKIIISAIYLTGLLLLLTLNFNFISPHEDDNFYMQSGFKIIKNLFSEFCPTSKCIVLFLIMPLFTNIPVKKKIEWALNIFIFSAEILIFIWALINPPLFFPAEFLRYQVGFYLISSWILCFCILNMLSLKGEIHFEKR